MCKHFQNGPELRTSSWSRTQALKRSKTLLGRTFVRHIWPPESDTLFGSDNTCFVFCWSASIKPLRYKLVREYSDTHRRSWHCWCSRWSGHTHPSGAMAVVHEPPFVVMVEKPVWLCLAM